MIYGTLPDPKQPQDDRSVFEQGEDIESYFLHIRSIQLSDLPLSVVLITPQGKFFPRNT